MPARRTSQTWGQPTAQQDDVYSNYNVVPWGSGLQLGNTHEEGMFTTNNDYDHFLSTHNDNLEQMLNPGMYGGQGGTHSQAYQESNAAAFHPSFIPTPLQTTMGTGFLPPGEPPREGGDTNWMSSWESHAVDADLSMQVQQLQLESPTPSTSNYSTGLGVPNQSKKKEESGFCAQCGQTFGRKSDARRHENTAHGREIHACPMCNTICSRKDALQRHIRDQH